MGTYQGRVLSKRMYNELIEIVRSEESIERKEERIQELFKFNPEEKRSGTYKGYNPKQAEYTRRYRERVLAQGSPRNGVQTA